MAETLGSLCDKLTIIKLKQWHVENKIKLNELNSQEKQLQNEIDEFIIDAISGKIPLHRLTFASNKVFKQEGNFVPDIKGSISEMFSNLASVNCSLWHEQEKVYEFENIPMEEKNSVVKRLALLNLERNKCIDSIDKQFQSIISQISDKN